MSKDQKQQELLRIEMVHTHGLAFLRESGDIHEYPPAHTFADQTDEIIICSPALLWSDLCFSHIVRCQLFADNSHVGRFVNTLAADLEIFKPPPAAAGSCPPLSAMSGPIPTPSPGDIPRLAPQAQQNWTHRSSLEHTSLQAAAAPSTPSPTEGIDSDVSASKDERVEAVSRSSASDATRDAGTKVVLGGTHLTAARDEEDRKKDGMVTEDEVGALEKLWVHDSDGRRLLFADVSVYTR